MESQSEINKNETDGPPSFPNIDSHKFVVIKVGEQIYKALIDTGATSSYVGADLRQTFLDMDMPMRKEQKTVTMANGYRMTVSEHYTITFVYKDSDITGEMTFFPELNDDAIVGMNFLAQTNLRMLERQLQLRINFNDGHLVADDGSDDLVALARTEAPDDPFKGIILKGKRHHRAFFIYRPWGRISVRMNKKGTKASLKFRNKIKRIDVSK